MKRAIVGLICLIAVATFAEPSDETEFRIFTDLQGRVIEARILDSKPDGTVQIERRNGQKGWVSPDIFCNSDQLYLRAWLEAQLFLSDQCLRVSADKVTKGREVYYTLKLENLTDQPIRNLKVEYNPESVG